MLVFASFQLSVRMTYAAVLIIRNVYLCSHFKLKHRQRKCLIFMKINQLFGIKGRTRNLNYVLIQFLPYIFVFDKDLQNDLFESLLSVWLEVTFISYKVLTNGIAYNLVFSLSQV